MEINAANKAKDHHTSDEFKSNKDNKIDFCKEKNRLS